jgi:hypothetical protein
MLNETCNKVECRKIFAVKCESGAIILFHITSPLYIPGEDISVLPRSSLFTKIIRKSADEKEEIPHVCKFLVHSLVFTTSTG